MVVHPDLMVKPCEIQKPSGTLIWNTDHEECKWFAHDVYVRLWLGKRMRDFSSARYKEKVLIYQIKEQ